MMKAEQLSLIHGILLIGLFCLSGLAAFAQRDSVDVWIFKLDNSQLRGTCHYAWTLELKEDAIAAAKLIAYGKPATKKLIKALSDPGRNIVSHYILASVWGPLDIRTTHFDDIKITYQVTGIQFESINDRLNVAHDEAVRMRTYWKQRLRDGR